MNEVIGDYQGALLRAATLLEVSGINAKDLVQCDTICYRVETNERYDTMKQLLGSRATLLDEAQVNGRLIAVYLLEEPLQTTGWDSISYIELPQPKSASDYSEGIDHVQFVTRQNLSAFREKYGDVAFDEKGLSNHLNPLLKLIGDGVSIKFHDKHMGAVVEMENKFHSI